MKKILCICLAMILLCGILVSCGNNKTVDTQQNNTTQNGVQPQQDLEGEKTPEKEQTPEEEQSVGIALPPVMGDDIVPTDYSKAESWLNIPDTDYDVDVFYLYPTAWVRGENEPYVCEMDNASMIAGAELMYMAQATAFETVGNVYAPYYRQVDAVWILQEPLETMEPYFNGVPYTDAVAAFEYYLENYNNGKPFILAGHSQGSAITKSIVKYYMKEHPEVYERMVAAYVIGYYVTDKELADNPHMKFAKGADDTGVVVSWNVEAPETDVNPLAPKGSVSINPISWTLEEEVAPKEDNLGSEIFNRQAGSITKMEQLADAAVNKERGTVVCSTVDIEQYSPGANGLFPRGVYHAQDYGFYYYNIRENAGVRIDKFLSENNRQVKMGAEK